MSKLYDAGKPFQTIADAARTTGLSQFFLRKSCKDGSCPHVKSGSTYMVNVPLLIEQLNAKSVSNS